MKYCTCTIPVLTKVAVDLLWVCQKMLILLLCEKPVLQCFREEVGIIQ